MQNIFIDFLPPWVETGLQPAFYDKESGTVLQQVARMYAKVNELIASYNSFTDNITNQQNDFEKRIDDTVDEYIEKFIALKDFVDNYFDNLDVQEEINNKLDAMVEAGTLQEIITTYIQSNVAWTFDTVADMKLATNLVDGSYARTLGFHTLNDGGGATYYITDTATANEMDVIAVDDLYAVLVVPAVVTPEMLGAYGDSTHDDQDSINRALDLSDHVQFNAGKTYAIRGYEDGQAEGGSDGLLETTGLVVKSGSEVDLNGATIIIQTTSRQNYHGFTVKNVSDVTIKNGHIIGDVETHSGATGEWGYGVALLHATNVNLLDLNISKCWGDGINLNNSTGSAGSDNKNIYIKDCICDDNRRQGMSIESVDGLVVEDSQFINTGSTAYTAPCSGVDIEPANHNKCEYITFDKCEFKNNRRSGLIATNSTIINHIQVLNSILTNNMAGQESINDHGNIAFVRGQYILVENCTIGGTDKGNICFRTGYTGSATEHNYITLRNNTFFNQHFLVRPIDCNYVDFNFEGNTITSDEDFNTYIIQFETNTGYTSNNVFVNLNCIGNTFKCQKTNTILGWVYCGNFNTSGVNKCIINNNTFYYATKQLYLGVPSVIDSNKFICNGTSVINILGSGVENGIFVISNNIFEYCNAKNSARGLIEDYPTIYYIYALKNTVLTDVAINPNDIPSDAQTHSDVMKMFVYDRTNSVSANNNIY